MPRHVVREVVKKWMLLYIFFSFTIIIQQINLKSLSQLYII